MPNLIKCPSCKGKILKTDDDIGWNLEVCDKCDLTGFVDKIKIDQAKQAREKNQEIIDSYRDYIKENR